jgi:hypothetical protein
MLNFLVSTVKFIGGVVLFTAASMAFAQSPATPAKTEKNQFSLVFGLNQPLVLRGFNFEVNYYTKRWVFDYSHGIGLHADGSTLNSDYEDQKVNFRITHSAGIGFGYRFTKAFNVRIEPKVHVYETYYAGDTQTRANSIANFTTYTLGLGAYYRWLPFEHKNNALKGITIVPSVRYWHKVDSTLHNDKMEYFNTKTNQQETLKAPNIGLANTPLILNVSIGYTF